MKSWNEYYERKFTTRKEKDDPETPRLPPDPARPFDEVLAQRIRANEIQGFFGLVRQDFIVGPGEVALIVRDGRIEDTVTQTRLKSMGKGLVDSIKSLFGAGEQRELVLINTNARAVELGFSQPSKDNHEISGKAVIHLQVDQSRASSFLGAIGRREYFSTRDLVDALRQEVIATVIESQIKAHDAAEFRGNTPLQRAVESAGLVELNKTLDTYGLRLTRFFIVWDRSAYEALLAYETKVETVLKYAGIDHNAELTGIRREHETVVLGEEQKWQLTVSSTTNEQKRLAIIIQGTIERQASQFNEVLRQTRSNDEQELWRRTAAYELEERGENAEARRATDLFKMVQDSKRERIRLQQSHELDQMKEQSRVAENVTKAAIEKGTFESRSLEELYRQQSMQRALDRDPAKVQALAAAEAERHKLDTYKQAQERAEQHALGMAERMAKMMDAAKPNVPTTLVEGGGAQPRISLDAGAQKRTAKAKQKTCSVCAREYDDDADFCTADGTRLTS